MGEPDHIAKTSLGFEYFIKDCTSTSRSESLGNVRAVITSEDAEYTDKFLVTMETRELNALWHSVRRVRAKRLHAVIEEENFDNLNETREDLPTAYPVDGSVYLNERIASLSAENGTEMGPSLVMPVKKGDKVSLSTSYFYEEDAPGTTYQNMDFFLNEILLALASSGSGVLNLGETQLINMASGGDQTLNNSIMSLLSTEFDTTDVDKPHAYLVWMFYDQNMNLDIANSGAAKVENPNSLETLLRNDLDVSKDGYLHAYVSNGSDAKVNFDNFLVQYQRGKLRQINDYYPYGLTIAGLNSNSDEYLNKYTSKELQTGEFDTNLSTGLEMFDFGSRFYDPQLGVWFTPDPAEQFHNPYLGIGNNPVSYVDPDGEFIFIAAGFLVGAYIGGTMANDHGNPAKWNWNKPAETIAGMAIGGAIGAFGGHALAASKAGLTASGVAAKGSGAAAKSATVFGNTMTQAAGKKYFGATVGGMVNSISEYDGQESFGWGTLADFGAGFTGSYSGAHFDSNFMGFMIGGTANSISQGVENSRNENYSSYNIAQSFVGGGLSSLVGGSYGGVNGNGIFAGKTKLGKYANSFLRYGSQATMYDFAYSSQSTFTGRSFGDHLGMFAAGGLYGSLSAEAFKGKWGGGEARDTPKWWRSLTGATAFATDYSIGALIKGRAYGNFYSGQSQKNKGGIFGLKYAAFSFGYLGY